MRLIGPTLLSEFQGKIVNIHPSLTSCFSRKRCDWTGVGSKCEMTGVTVHFVDEGMDTGPIIDQQAVTIDEDETKESLQRKIHEIEHKLYPAVLQKLFQEEKTTSI